MSKVTNPIITDETGKLIAEAISGTSDTKKRIKELEQIVEGKADKSLITYVTPEQFGAVGDGVSDDTEAFKAMLQNYETNIVLTKKYAIDTNIFVITKDGTNVSGGGTLIANNVGFIGNYYICSVYANNVSIDGITCDYDRNHQTAKDGQEWGHCFVIGRSLNEGIGTQENITISNCRALNSLGDGFSIRAKNAKLINCEANKSWRNGFTVVSELSFLTNCRAIDTKGTLPECGIDVEPDKDRDITCTISDFYSYNNKNCAVILSAQHLHNCKWNVDIDNMFSVADGYGVVGETCRSIVALTAGNLETGAFNVSCNATIISGKRTPFSCGLSNSENYKVYGAIKLIDTAIEKPIMLTKCRSNYVTKINVDVIDISQSSSYPYYTTYIQSNPIPGQTDPTDVILRDVYVNYNNNGYGYKYSGDESHTALAGTTYDIEINFPFSFKETPKLLYSIFCQQNGVADKWDKVNHYIRKITPDQAIVRFVNRSDIDIDFSILYSAQVI